MLENYHCVILIFSVLKDLIAFIFESSTIVEDANANIDPERVGRIELGHTGFAWTWQSYAKAFDYDADENWAYGNNGTTLYRYRPRSTGM